MDTHNSSSTAEQNANYYAVIFRSYVDPENSEGYQEMAQRIEELAKQQIGYLGIESARGPDGVGLTISYWKDQASIHNWKNVAAHQKAQELGKSKWYDYYTVRVCQVEREYHFKRDENEPAPTSDPLAIQKESKAKNTDIDHDESIDLALDFRLAQETDAEPISNIYNYFVDNSICVFVTEHETVSERIEWIRHHNDRHPAFVCTHADEVIGFASLSQWSVRSGYSRTAELSIYVHHQWHQRGIGKQLLSKLIESAKEIGYHALIGIVCTEQVASIKLQQAFGFKQVAYLPETGFKFGRWLDVVYLQLIL